jgi:hypothetical protein
VIRCGVSGEDEPDGGGIESRFADVVEQQIRGFRIGCVDQHQPVARRNQEGAHRLDAHRIDVVEQLDRVFPLLVHRRRPVRREHDQVPVDGGRCVRCAPPASGSLGAVGGKPEDARNRGGEQPSRHFNLETTKKGEP